MMKQCGCGVDFSCGCCEGVEALTPQPTANRPGLSALRWRAGTHATFFETMRARLSNFSFADSEADKKNPLAALRTRLVSDPAIALLSAAATVLDVLTFYQERIANEGFLRTATERRSILELGRLVGYAPRPGVAASVYLAYTMDDKSAPVEIPTGARAQSVPMQDELPQSFETSEKLAARKEWNNLQPRMSQPQKITFDNALTIEMLYFDGTDTKLKPNDPLLFVFEKERQVLRRVQTVTPQFENKITQVVLQIVPPAAFAAFRLMDELRETLRRIIAGGNADDFEEVFQNAETLEQNIRLGSYPLDAKAKDISSLQDNLKSLIRGNGSSLPQLSPILEELNKLVDTRVIPTAVKIKQTNLNNLFKSLLISPSVQPVNNLQLGRSLKKTFNLKSDIRTKLLANFRPQLKETLYPTLSKATVSVVQPKLQAVYALRVTAPLFGYNAPMITFKISPNNQFVPQAPVDPELKDEHGHQLFLDSPHEQILSGDKNKPSHIVINRQDANSKTIETFQIKEAKIQPRTAYSMSGSTTALILNNKWWNPQPESRGGDGFDTIRKTIVHAQSEQLTPADKPINDDVSGDKIELGALYEGLEIGRWIIVSGARADIPGANGIPASELAMLAGVEQSFKPGDKYHTTLYLAGQNINGKPGLQYKYKRDTVKIYGNVVKATHGETRNEVLGSGNAAQAMQTFALKQPPLTFVSAPTPSGIESTLEVRVNDVKWHETDSLAGLKPQDRKFITKTDDEAKTSVVFGNGWQGARLPTGIENVKAVYRSGIGKSGNVKAEQISLLMTKPLGVKEVVNPLGASGGADKETRDQARRNIPIALLALDRLVSTKDYADFARTFAGVGKSSAARLSDGRRQVVHLTIAGAEDIAIDVNSDLYKNLRRALAKYGNSFQPIQVVNRETLALVIAASVGIRADYLWEAVAPKIRAALLDAFSFERRELGQSVFLSEVVGVIQNVEGVVYSDVDVLDGISETDLSSETLLREKVAAWASASQPKPFVQAKLARKNPDSARANSPQARILPAQLAYLMTDVPDTLILNRVKEVKK